MPSISTVSVVGVGLIGGSFALALRRLGFAGRVLGVSSPATISRALDLGVIDRGCSLAEALPVSDLVYMAQPVTRILDQLEEVSRLVPGHALVTDAGSTKRQIVDRARELFVGGPDFIGGHPMAGKEGRGVDVAEAGLFDGAMYALVPTGESLPDSPVVRTFRGWLDAMGCRQRVMDPVAHDRTVAWTSHMPQLVSTALAAALGDKLTCAEDLEVAGDGLLDMTRLAASPHEVWAAILATNADAIDDALQAFVREIEGLRGSLPVDNGEEHFGRANALRTRIDGA